MPSESLSSEDAVLLAAEAPGTQLQIGALCFFEAAPLEDPRGRVRTAELRSHVTRRLESLPRFRQRVERVLGDFVAPRWVDDVDFDIRRHVASVRLPGPGGIRELRATVDRLLSEPLDTRHPLWDLHLVHGGLVVPDVNGEPVEAVAVLMRAHHVMADGLALHAAATLLLDPAPAPTAGAVPPWSPSTPPGSASLSAAAMVERAVRQADIALRSVRLFADPRNLCGNSRMLLELLSGVPRAHGAIAPEMPFTGAIGPGRSFAWSSLQMQELLEVKHSCGASLNDVVLAIVTGAVRRTLLATDSFDTTAPEPQAIIPIGGPRTDLGSLGNRFSITKVALPVGVDDPLERVRRLHRRMHATAPSPAQRLMPHLFSIADVVPPRVLRVVVPALLARQPLVNLAVSNIPGSREPLYLWDSLLLGMHPFINVVGNVGLIVGVLSYGDTLGVGVTVDPAVAGEPTAFIGHLEDAADELVAAVRGGQDGSPDPEGVAD